MALMKSFKESICRKLMPLMTVLALLGLPVLTRASGGEENIQLQFGSQDYIYLGISAAIGVIAIIVAFAVRSKILSQSPGDEKMQEVGKAINDGAIAYLAKQRNTISIFVVILSVALGALYASRYDMTSGIMIAVAFILGVAASYIAGYMGMTMAVASNMRTAHAALTKFGKALETAFRSGAVAGLFTVGMGLIGATAIFAFGGENAMKLLVGFGFGGSLAALFMRVGGGIYTKAADVGADLVGKVEAGIPEDDPRNPAVIADNVGDNVGDCAGMAADVFESYEVTLVAAIVLGAATAAIFDQNTWMKLILFALMARGIGIIASIIGVFMVKGDDNVDSDPLKPISAGFKWSAIIAVLMTAGLAFFMMGGTGATLQSHTFVSPEQSSYEQNKAIVSVQNRLAVAQKKPKWEIKAEDVAKDPEVKKFFTTEKPEEVTQIVQGAMSLGDRLVEPKALNGYRAVSLDDKHNKTLDYATQYVAL
ncbi:MAG: sodium/proton-translocating pyrophosphatase, partial [Chthonomonadaceae bacterium]|nr:sodium/proton-translocating pyrophosphatase [Chthonomonadaceae bacterium]